MFVHDFGESWLDHPFWRTRFLISEAADLEKLRASGIDWVHIDTARGLDVAPDASADARAPGSRATEPETSSGREEPPLAGTDAANAREPRRAADDPAAHRRELARARRLVAEARPKVEALFSEARMGRVPDARAARALVDEISASIERSSDALVSLARLKTRDDYTYMHSVAVCGLMIRLARELRMPPAAVRSAGFAGLLHDIGKVFIAPEVLNKPGALTGEEFALVRSHPRRGWELLKDATDIEPAALEVCLHHHERVGGFGYPDGLSAESIGRFARMGAVCDVYDAVTSERPYNHGWNPSEALSRMASWNGHFDPLVFQAFVRAVGIYPIGSLVRLESGRVGVVVEQTPESLLAPRVRAFFSTRTNAPIAPLWVQAGRGPGRDRIVAREDPRSWVSHRIDDLWLTA